MVTAKIEKTEKPIEDQLLTIDLLNSLLIDFSMGRITLDGLWECINKAGIALDATYFRKSFATPIRFNSLLGSLPNIVDGSDDENSI